MSISPAWIQAVSAASSATAGSALSLDVPEGQNSGTAAIASRQTAIQRQTLEEFFSRIAHLFLHRPASLSNGRKTFRRSPHLLRLRQPVPMLAENIIVAVTGLAGALIEQRRAARIHGILGVSELVEPLLLDHVVQVFLLVLAQIGHSCKPPYRA